jgi:hypothetical protein
MAALDEFLEPLGEPRSRRTIDDVVVKAGGDIQILADFDPAVHDPWLFANPTAVTLRVWPARGIPQPPPSPNMPTLVISTVPAVDLSGLGVLLTVE